MKIQPLSNLSKSAAVQRPERRTKPAGQNEGFAHHLERARSRSGHDHPTAIQGELSANHLAEVLTASEKQMLKKIYRSEDDFACYDVQCRKLGLLTVGRKVDFKA